MAYLLQSFPDRSFPVFGFPDFGFPGKVTTADLLVYTQLFSLTYDLSVFSLTDIDGLNRAYSLTPKLGLSKISEKTTVEHFDGYKRLDA